MQMRKDSRLEDCTLCPRQCHVNRVMGQKGYCKETADVVVARAALHMWEETCISGKDGSGAVFFAGCNMGCVFCQNYHIARNEAGKKISVERLAEIFLELQGQSANNINLVTPTHYVPQIIDALDLAKERGLRLPVVYNTSGYEKVETLQMLKGYVDIGNVLIDNNCCERTVRPFANLRKSFGGFSSELGARVTAVYLTFIETCKLMKRVSLDFFKGFFDMTSGGRSDYELITQELLC